MHIRPVVRYAPDSTNRTNVAPRLPPRAAPRPVPPRLMHEKLQYQEHVRQLQGINRFQRKRAVADQLLLPVRGLFAFIPIPVPGLHWLGLGAPIGLQRAHVNSHEGRDPGRLRKHLFEAETSRRQSVKVVKELGKMGVVTPENRYQRPIADAELNALKTRYKLTDEATVKIGWALETFAQITDEQAHVVPTPWGEALPPG